MEWYQALLLGLVEGLTEFLPVSSTAHLVVAQRLLGVPRTAAADAYAICIQLGAILAVLGLYRARVLSMLRGLAGKDPAGLRLLGAVVVAFLPGALVAKALGDLVKERLFGPWPIIGAWALGGVVILALARSPRLRAAEGQADAPTPLDPTLRQALLIGLAQCLALWPGTSRSLVTILAGAFVGLPFLAAIEFAFLLGLLSLAAATADDALKHGRVMLDAFGPGTLALGVVVAFATSAVVVRAMLRWMATRGLALFGWWRLAAAAVVSLLVLSGRLTW